MNIYLAQFDYALQGAPDKVLYRLVRSGSEEEAKTKADVYIEGVLKDLPVAFIRTRITSPL